MDYQRIYLACFQSLDWVERLLGWKRPDVQRTELVLACFQSLDWVERLLGQDKYGCYMTDEDFQSLDWVERLLGATSCSAYSQICRFQSLDWVERLLGFGRLAHGGNPVLLSIPRLG